MRLKTRILVVIIVVISGLTGISAISGWLLHTVDHLKKAETVCDHAMESLEDLKQLTRSLLITDTLDNTYAQWKKAYALLDNRLNSLKKSRHLNELLDTEIQQAMMISMESFWQTTCKQMNRVDQSLKALIQNKSPSRDGLIYQYFNTKDYNILRIKNQIDKASLYIDSEFESRLSKLIEMVDDEISRQMHLTIRNIILTSLLISAAVCLILIFFLYRLNFNLRQWHKAMQTLGRGDFPEKLPVKGQDELGLIADAINQTSENLKKINHELEKRIFQLNQARQEAESADQAKSLFLAKMSHELKTPLNAILGFSRLAAQGSPGRALWQKQVLSITRNAEHLLTLINDVLSMAKIEAGGEQINESVVDLPKLMKEIGQLFFPRAREKKIEIQFTGTDNVPCLIMADRIKLSQILINLIQNALKFTDAGTINIDVKTRRYTSDNDPDSQILCFSVKDTGCGINPDNIEAIFEPFTQIQSKIAQGIGTGLGLAICKNYISMMNGRLWVKSTPGKGSIFSFSIPLITVDAVSGNQTFRLAQQDNQKIAPEKKSENHGLGNDEIKDRLASISDSIIGQLKDAALRADTDSVISALTLVESHDPELSDILYDLADAFEYERLLELCSH